MRYSTAAATEKKLEIKRNTITILNHVTKRRKLNHVIEWRSFARAPVGKTPRDSKNRLLTTKMAIWHRENCQESASPNYSKPTHRTEISTPLHKVF